MGEKKWTEGPWEVGKSGPNKMPTVGTKYGLMVAHITVGVGHPGDENAHLVAAAPELYEALESLVITQEYKEEHGKDKAYELARKTSWNKGILALAKARGEE